MFALEFAISHRNNANITLTATRNIEDAERIANRGLITLDYQPDGSVRVTPTEAGDQYARDAFGPDGYQWLTEHCACRNPHN